MLDSFTNSFRGAYSEYVDTKDQNSKELLKKIHMMGRNAILKIFKGVNEFIYALFESLMAMYDPTGEGHLEEIERDLDKMVLKKTVQG